MGEGGGTGRGPLSRAESHDKQHYREYNTLGFLKDKRPTKYMLHVAGGRCSRAWIFASFGQPHALTAPLYWQCIVFEVQILIARCWGRKQKILKFAL